MKIYILSDESWFGGASIANHRIIEELQNRGHDVSLKTINKDKDDWQGDMSADLYVVANWAFIDRKLLEKLFYEKPVVKFYHDIPGYMYQPKSIIFEEHYKFMQYMIDNARLNIFISKLQQHYYSRFVNVNKDNCIILPPPKDMSKFKNENKERNGKAFYLGDISEARGISHVINVSKQNNWDVVFAGPWVDKKLAEQLQDAGYEVYKEIEQEEVVEMMNEYSYFIYLPNLVDSFCFKILEAELCNIQIVADIYRIGRYTYDMAPEDLVKLVNTSHIKIADKIEEIYNAESDE